MIAIQTITLSTIKHKYDKLNTNILLSISSYQVHLKHSIYLLEGVWELQHLYFSFHKTTKLKTLRETLWHLQFKFVELRLSRYQALYNIETHSNINTNFTFKVSQGRGFETTLHTSRKSPLKKNIYKYSLFESQ
jgi:hypothetical protein